MLQRRRSPLRRALGALPVLLLLCTTLVVARRAGAQGSQQSGAVARGLDLEQAGRFREAAAAYREALRGPDMVPAMLGLERVYTELRWTDTLRLMIDTLVRTAPRNPTVRTVQIRSLRAEGREADARAAFERWVHDAPGDPYPYQEYARQLIAGGQAASADTVLSRAAAALGPRASGLAFELASARSALGLWEPAAASWREALAQSSYLAQAAVFALQPAPASARGGIARALAAPPVSFVARQVLSRLALAWGAPRDAWLALRDLPPSDSAAAAWREFADMAEASASWQVARDALMAAATATTQRGAAAALVARAAGDALNGGDAAGALSIASSATPTAGDTAATLAIVAVKVRALSALGRAAEADALVQRAGASLDERRRAELRRGVAWGWIKAGDIAKARAALGAAGPDSADVDEGAEGWIALYEGDLATARKKLGRAADATPELVTARALLARSRAERSPAVGGAFLTLARGDTTRAAAQFAEAGREVPDAAPLLLAVAARLHAARHDDAAAVPLWSAIVGEYAAAPEAAEADLEWGRALRRQGDTSGAVARFEHLILTYPQSALVPQARREMERAKGQTAS